MNQTFRNVRRALIAGVVVVGIIILVTTLIGGGDDADTQQASKLTPVYGAVGGGKENFLKDEDINRILAEEYGIELKLLDWSNGQLTDANLAADTRITETYGKSARYDFVFFSDIRYYEQYQAARNETYRKRDGYIALNTPIVLYSWKPIAEAFEREGIVTQADGVYYLSDMPKLLSYIDERKPWSELGGELARMSGAINITSVDPVTSSPGATYYGLLAAIDYGKDINEGDIAQVLEKLQSFYIRSGFMNGTPADLFDLYLRTGMGAKPLIVDYEKSLIDWAISHPDAYKSLQDRIVILYPEPTSWNNHCILSFTENGGTYLEALEKNTQIQEIAFSRYGFRAGLSNAYANTREFTDSDGNTLIIEGIPSEIVSVVPGLRMESYNKIIDALKETIQ